MCSPELLCGFAGTELGPKTSCADSSTCGAGESCCDPFSEGQTFCAPQNLCGTTGVDDSCTADSDCSGGQVCCKDETGESTCEDACEAAEETGAEETGAEETGAEETGGEGETSAGACVNPADTALLDSLGEAGLTEIGESCGPGCFLSGDKKGCFGDCYSDNGFSDACSECFGEIGACTMDNCLDGFSADEACIEVECQPAFDACSGI